MCKAAKKGNQILELIKKTITCWKKEVLIRLYKSVVRPPLEYCVQAWRPLLLKEIMLLEKVQMSNEDDREVSREVYEERLEIVGLTTLENKRMKADLIEVFKIFKGFEGIDEKPFFIRHISINKGAFYEVV